jgi:hypothetical protein
MRRLALLGLLLLSGCQGTGTFLGDTFSFPGVDPNAPVGDSETLDRVRGAAVAVPPVTPEPGNVWPPASQPIPSLYDVEKQQGENPNAPPPSTTPALPAHRQPTRGSSTPPPNNEPGLQPLPEIPTVPPGPEVQPLPGPPAGRTVQTPGGPAVTGNPVGGSGVQTTILPGGGQGIMIPNGNGTSTLIGPSGSVTTVPTPK